MEHTESQVMSLFATSGELDIAMAMIAKQANALIGDIVPNTTYGIVADIRQVSVTSIYKPDLHRYEVAALILASVKYE